jgi:nucleoside-diphosphate-sugar epimerase
MAGFVGSHLQDYLLEKGEKVYGIDNFLTGDKKNLNDNAEFFEADIRNIDQLSYIFNQVKPDVVIHEAANCRTFLSVADPILNNSINVDGTLNMLECSLQAKVKRFVFASSCILNSPRTPYYVSKLAGEEYVRIYNSLYGLPTVNLRYSNVYGSLRQSEKGSHINALASLHKSKRDTGRIWITGDGTQTRDWTHVADICRATYLAAQSEVTVASAPYIDICTGLQTSMNTIAQFFNVPIDYVPEEKGDSHDLSEEQHPFEADVFFEYEYEIPLNADSLKVYTEI